MFGLFNKYKWCHRDWSSNLWHRCGVCQQWLREFGSHDYICPNGHYELHWECGQFKCRVGEEWIEFRERTINEKRYGLDKIKEACRSYIISKSWLNYKDPPQEISKQVDKYYNNGN
jgi:hypothetical protein